MQVVGARFRTVAAATAALLAVRSSVQVAPGDLGVRPLGSTRYEEPTSDFLLAGRFADEDVRTVSEIVEAQGGRIIERRRELPGRVAPRGRPSGPQVWAASNPPWTPPWAASRSATGSPGVREPAARPRKRLRRPAAPLRIRAARALRFR